MAFQPFIQMIWGRPEIVALIKSRTFEDTTILECAIVNYPITKGLLNKLYITRNTAIGLIALFDIKDSLTGNEVYGELPLLRSQAGEATQRIDLPPGYVPARFTIATIDEADGKVYPGFVKPSKRQGSQVLNVGLYTVSIKVDIGGKTILDTKKILKVETTSPYGRVGN